MKIEIVVAVATAVIAFLIKKFCRRNKDKASQTEWSMKAKTSTRIVKFGQKSYNGNTVRSQTKISMIKTMNRFQSYVADVNAVVLIVNVKILNITVASHTKLEIEYKRQQNKDMLMTIELKSTNIDITKKIYVSRDWQDTSEIVACLKFKDGTLKEQKGRMKKDENVLDFKDEFKLHFTIKELNIPDVRFTTLPDISLEERNFIERRKAVVAKSMTNGSKPDQVPITAIIGSGGGMRAVIGMGAAVSQLKEHKILDRTMYIAGLSGSSWYLTSLYASDDDFNPDKVNDQIRTALDEFAGIKYWIVWLLWKYFSNFNPGRNFTVTSLFGEIIGRTLLPKNWKNKWSDQRERLKKADVPLPLISVLHCRNEETIEEHHEWMEFSPYEVFIPKYGVGIDMKYFGDRFYRGYRLEENSEPSIGFLQGVCGSAYAKVRNFKPSGKKWYMSGRVLKTCIGAVFRRFDKIFIAKVPNFLLGIELSRQNVVNKECEADVNKDYDNPEMMLVDAGLSFNSPYPSVLHPDRKVDVIISCDFSDRGTDLSWPFEELEHAQKWARKRSIPFPELDLEDIRIDWNRGIRKPVYVFPGDNAPTIAHIVMMDVVCSPKGSKYDFLQEYRTLRFGYNKDEFDKFSDMVKDIIEEEHRKINECLIDKNKGKIAGLIANQYIERRNTDHGKKINSPRFILHK